MKKRLVLANIFVVLLGLLAAFLLAMPLVQQLYQTEFTRRLDTALALMLDDRQQALSSSQDFCVRKSEALQVLGQRMRVTIIALDGAVLADSDPDLPDGVGLPTENHLSRPEVQQALQEGRGYDIRQSDSVKERFYYAAALAPGEFYIRVALPMTELDGVMLDMRLCLIAGMLTGVLVACVLAFFTASSLSKPLIRLTDATRRIAEGDFNSRVEESGGGELRELARAFNTMADTTQNAFSELNRKKRQLEGVLQGLDDGVLAVNGTSRVMLVNARARLLLDAPGLSEGDALVGSMALEQLFGIMRSAREQEAVVHEELKTGSPEREMTVYAAPLNANKPNEGALAVLTDVTEMRKLQQLRSEFVANVTHELKTPLTSIRGFIELLKSGDRDEETRRYFYDVLDIEAERLHHLIDDMLVLSQIENTKEDASAGRCDLQKELSCTVERLRPLAEKAGLTLVLEAEDGLFVEASSTRLQQLFGNLIENAVKYNQPNGSIQVTAQRQRGMAVVRVADTGIGIAPEHLGRLFERFYRVDTSRSREIGGTGLGLSIVKHLAGLYHGDVSVESKPQVGSTFTVRLPLVP